MAQHLASNAEKVIQSLAAEDPWLVDQISAQQEQNIKDSGLSPKVYGLVNIAALVAENASQPSFHWRIANSLKAGATADEIAGILVALTANVGMAKIVSAAPKVGWALGYEIAEFEKEMKKMEKADKPKSK